MIIVHILMVLAVFMFLFGVFKNDTEFSCLGILFISIIGIGGYGAYGISIGCL